MLAGVAALLLAFARLRGVGTSLPILAVVLLSLLGSNAGTIIKPEILSLVAFNLLLFVYAMARNADRDGREAAPWFMAIPAIVLFWVNTHGGFVFAAAFFTAAFIGEMLKRWIAPQYALSPHGLRAMLLALSLSAAAVFLTPYGWRYPAQLVATYLLHTGPRVGEVWNNAYQSLLSGGLSEIAIYGLLIGGAIISLVLTRDEALCAQIGACCSPY